MRLSTIVLDGTEVAAVEVAGMGLVPVPTVAPDLPDTILGLIEVGLDPALRRELTARAEQGAAAHALAPDAVRYGPLYRRPRKIWGIGLNYRSHADDLDETHPDEPASFMKGDHTIIGPGDPIVLPRQSVHVTAEAELGLIVGTTCRDVEPSEALDHIVGVCPVLDQTAIDILQRNPRFLTRAKNFPSFFSFGPVLVTIDEILGPDGGLGHVQVGTYRNDQMVREDVVAGMAHGPETLISLHSQVMPLYPGDIISPGSPGGARVQDGDVASCRIPGVGTLTNPVVRREAPDDASATETGDPSTPPNP